jgi:hypothetical protein
MGIISHHAIVVTASYGDYAERAHAKARDIFDGVGALLSELSPVTTNGTRSFCVFPDGSKEGWGASEEGDGRRNDLIEWLGRQRYGDGSTPYTWAEIEMGECGSPSGNNDGACVRRHYAKGIRIGDSYRGPAEIDVRAEVNAMHAKKNLRSPHDPTKETK